MRRLHSIQDQLFVLCGDHCPIQLDKFRGKGRGLIVHIVTSQEVITLSPLPLDFFDLALKICTDDIQIARVGDQVLHSGVVSSFLSNKPILLNCELDVELIHLY